MKRTLLLTITLLALLTVSALAYEVDMSYTGTIDSFTGQPIDEGTMISNAEIVMLSANSYYDRKDGMFVYQISGVGDGVRCSVADGMVTNNPVTLSIPDGVDCTLHRDGKQVDLSNVSELSEEGIYDLSVTAQGTKLLRFSIVVNKTADIVEYRLPGYFMVSGVLRDGTAVATPPQTIDLKEEGFYQITYRCVLTGVSYQLELPIDRTPPTLALEAVVDGIAKGPVDISDVEDGASVHIELDGEEEKYTSELTKSGSYVVSITDPAGNTTTYKFLLQVYFNTSSLVFFAVFLVIVGSLIFYIVRSRKRLRIR